jgi:hypothetical protein
MLSPEKCAALAEAFLRDAAAKARIVSENIIIAFFPPEELESLQKILPGEQIFLAQDGENLGERMLNAFAAAFARQYDEVVMIGTDSPTFPIDYIEQAFEFLETNSDVVLGKTEDGGFYLIGLRVLRPEIFAGVRWSSTDTFEQVYRNAQRLELHLRETPGWYDVDEAKDLRQLGEELRHNENARRRAPQTDFWIKKNLF